MKKSKNALRNFMFLSDKALKDVNEDRLEHLSIANSLDRIIRKCPLPFTIGLFGKWGTGKSTISNFLKTKLGRKNSKIAVIEFDVWKYEKDSLRRQFLISLEKQLKKQKFLKGYSLNQRLLASVSISFEGKLRFSKEKSVQLGLFLLLVLVALVSFGKLAYHISPFVLSAYIGSVSSLLSIGVFLKFFKSISQIITAETKTLKYEKFKNPDEFEQEFEKMVDKAKAERILIIIDNLDRVTHKKAVELLSTIKTFLEPKSSRCIFLVQCDEEAIKSHLDNVYKNKEVIKKTQNETTRDAFDSDEFLRKFFNAFVKMPPFIDADLEKYTKEQLEKIGVERFSQDSDLVSVITKAFRENPRQIKQFINTLLSHYLIVLDRESGKEPIIKPGIISDNPAFLAKFLIIRQNWPDYYVKIVEDPKKLQEYSLEENKKLVSFMRGTDIVKTDSIRSFIYLKQSSRKLALSDIGDSLEIAFEDNKKEEAIQFLREAKGRGISDEKVSDFLLELLDRNIGSAQNLINTINLTAHAYKKRELLVNKKSCEKVAQIVASHLREQIHDLDLDFVFLVMTKSRPAFRKPIILRYAQILSQKRDSEVAQKIPNYSEYILHLVRLISANRRRFMPQRDNIRKALRTHSGNVRVLSALEDKPKAADDFITPEYLVDFVGTIGDGDLADTTYTEKGSLFGEKARLVLALDKKVDISIGEAFLQKITDLLNSYFQTPHTPERQPVLKEILSYTKLALSRYGTKLENKTIADQLADSLVNGANVLSDYSEKSAFIPPLFYLRGAVSDDKNASIDQQVNGFAQNSDLPVIRNLFEDIKEELRQGIYDLVNSELKSRALQEKDIFNFVWEFENDDGKTVLLTQVIASANYKFALDQLGEESYKIKGTKEIVGALLNKSVTLPVGERAQFYTAVNALKCGKDKELREQYAGQLKGLIVDQDRASQQVAHDACRGAFGFFSEAVKQRLSLDIIGWLNTIDPINSSHEFGLRIALLFWDNLSITHRDNLVNVIFDKWIAKTDSADEINTGFEFIYQLKPKVRYNSYKPHFDVLLARLDGEQNFEIKKAILVGLLDKIKTKPTKLSKPFWDKVKKMLKEQPE